MDCIRISRGIIVAVGSSIFIPVQQLFFSWEISLLGCMGQTDGLVAHIMGLRSILAVISTWEQVVTLWQWKGWRDGSPINGGYSSLLMVM